MSVYMHVKGGGPPQMSFQKSSLILLFEIVSHWVLGLTVRLGLLANKPQKFQCPPSRAGITTVYHYV